MRRLFLALLFCGVLLSGLTAAAAAQVLTPVDAILRVGDQIAITVGVSNTTDLPLDAVATYVDYDPTLFRVTGAQPISQSAWSRVLSHTATPGHYDLLLLATGDPVQPGHDGAVVVFTLQAQRPATYTVISLHREAPRRSAGAYRGELTGEVRPITRTVQIVAGECGAANDPNCDGALNVQDFSLLAHAFDSRTGDTRYSRLADVNADGVVDDTDLQLVWAALMDALGQP
jgi:hypothetical protein